MQRKIVGMLVVTLLIATAASQAAITGEVPNVDDKQSASIAFDSTASDNVLKNLSYTRRINENYNEDNTNLLSFVNNEIKPRHLKTPNDPFYSYQWSLNNYGKNPGVPTGLIDADIDAPQAWEHLTKSRVIVAVIDSGIDYFHPDIVDNIWRNYDDTWGDMDGDGNPDDDGNGFIDDVHGWDFINNDNDPMDDHGHGTHVAGIIGAVGNNSEGITGICWDIKLMALKISDESNSATWQAMADAINYAVDKHANVICISVGAYGRNDNVLQAIERANNENILIITGAGNDNRNIDGSSRPFYPVCYTTENIMGVGASNNLDQFWQWNQTIGSNYGINNVSIMAPGQDILSLGLHRNYSYSESVYYDTGNDNMVSELDRRIAIYYPEKLTREIVDDEDFDVGFPLVNFNPLERHWGSFIYYDSDNSSNVTVGDLRLTPTEGFGVGTRVTQGNPDLDRILEDFNEKEKHTIYSYKTGTSQATPHVAGAVAHFWSLFWNQLQGLPDPHLEVKKWILDINRVDSRPSYNLMVASGKNNDGRLRMICGDDFGDAPDPFITTPHEYPTISRYTGASHEDIGEEWLGYSHGYVSPEFDANVKSPWDADERSNIDPDRAPPNPEPPYIDGKIPDLDPDNGLSIPRLMIPGQEITILYCIGTQNEDIEDIENGRYLPGQTSSLAPDKRLHFNIWIDWNCDGDWKDTFEHVFYKAHDPTLEWKGRHFSGWLEAKITIPIIPFLDFQYEQCIETWLRARLDYGENVGNIRMFDSHDSLKDTYGLAQYGEVEDYPIHVQVPAKLIPSIPFPYPFWSISDNSLISKLFYTGQETIIIKPSYVTQPDYLGSCYMTWIETQDLPWNILDETMLSYGDIAEFSIPISSGDIAAFIKYEVYCLEKPELLINRFIGEAILKNPWPSSPDFSYTITNFEIHNIYERLVYGFEWEFIGEYVSPDDIIDWHDPIEEPYISDGIWYGGWGCPPEVDTISDGIDVNWVDTIRPIAPGEASYFGLFLNPDIQLPTELKVNWIIFNAEPYKPNKPSGPTNGKAGLEYTYKFNATDPNGDQVYYLIDWGDGTTTEWIGPYDSEEIVSVSYSWEEEINSSIKFKAKDIFNAESDWSDPLSISMPKTKQFLNRSFLYFLQSFLEKYPLIYQLLLIFNKLLKL